MNEITKYVPPSEIQIMAEAVAKSGLFGIKTVEQAMALMLIANAEGMHPALAARDYHIIQGRPALKADAMLARFQAAGGTVKWGNYTDDVVEAIFSHPQGGSIEVRWDKKRALQAELGGKDMWKKYPRQMLRARVISEGIRAVFPGCVTGFYTPEEVSDFDDKPRAPRTKKDDVQEAVVAPAEVSFDEAVKDIPHKDLIPEYIEIVRSNKTVEQMKDYILKKLDPFKKAFAAWVAEKNRPKFKPNDQPCIDQLPKQYRTKELIEAYQKDAEKIENKMLSFAVIPQTDAEYQAMLAEILK